MPARCQDHARAPLVACAATGWLIALLAVVLGTRHSLPATCADPEADDAAFLRVADELRASAPEVRRRRRTAFERKMGVTEHPVDKIKMGYGQHYGSWFAPMRNKPIRMLEIGLRGGTSMLLWSNYFQHPDARIFGMGLPPPKGIAMGSILPAADPRAIVGYGSQANATFLDAFVAATGGNFQLIIDDASHVPQHGLFTLARLFSRALAPGGRYILEDTHTYFKPAGSLQYGFRYEGTGLGQPGNALELVTRYLPDLIHSPALRRRASLLAPAVDEAIGELSVGASLLSFTKKSPSWRPHDVLRERLESYYRDWRLRRRHVQAFVTALEAAKRSFWCGGMEAHLAPQMGIDCNARPGLSLGKRQNANSPR